MALVAWMRDNASDTHVHGPRWWANTTTIGKLMVAVTIVGFLSWMIVGQFAAAAGMLVLAAANLCLHRLPSVIAVEEPEELEDPEIQRVIDLGKRYADGELGYLDYLMAVEGIEPPPEPEPTFDEMMEKNHAHIVGSLLVPPAQFEPAYEREPPWTAAKKADRKRRRIEESKNEDSLAEEHQAQLDRVLKIKQKNQEFLKNFMDPGRGYGGAPVSRALDDEKYWKRA